jgi:hypothetical protein
MQFVRNGPDIPEALLDAHEDGRVVFFCGAGISYAAGLQGFDWLVDAIYERLGTRKEPDEQKAYSREQFDSTLDLLERRYPGQRLPVRRALHDVLQPRLDRAGATETHSALLELASDRQGALRLVTTNFDRIFEHVAEQSGENLHASAAPVLPIPKRARWDGLVYLHGLLPAQPDDAALQQLVLTSGDFGLAYLVDRWAARFVGSLFRNFTVCFVGYRIGDVVLRYMMDALAADQMLGETTPPVYALGACGPNAQASCAAEWQAKGVIPILYDPQNRHSALHRTLASWADIYRRGVAGKEGIIHAHAGALPADSTPHNDFVGRVLWALSDPSGLPAKHFAETNPAPPLEWLNIFADNRFGDGARARFGMQSDRTSTDIRRFSLISRPAPFHNAPWMSLVSDGVYGPRWDKVMTQLARWLCRHLNDPKLILWAAEQGGLLHEELHDLIQREMDRYAKLEQHATKDELITFRTHSPNAIPSPPMRTLWQLFLNAQVKSPRYRSNLYGWAVRFSRHGITTGSRAELRALLAPRVLLRPLFVMEEEEQTSTRPSVDRLVDWELELTADHVLSSLDDAARRDDWQQALAPLVDDLQFLLNDALDLFKELGAADEHEDLSVWHLPSIEPHRQNRRFRDWVALIELLRDAWLGLRADDADTARGIARAWFKRPYPTFKRLALFAAAQDRCIAPEEWVSWLTSDDAHWLWSYQTQRETLRLMVSKGRKLSTTARETLETAILHGPPHSVYRTDIDPKDREFAVDREIWLSLGKLRQSGTPLSDAAEEKFKALSAAYPDFVFSEDQREEFAHWTSGTGDPDFHRFGTIRRAPTKRGALAAWLKDSPVLDFFDTDTWDETCARHPINAGAALADLGADGHWPIDRWRIALNAWSDKRRPRRTWRCFGTVLAAAPDEVVQHLAYPLSRWLEVVGWLIDHDESQFLGLCDRLLSQPHPDESSHEDMVHAAINHPTGKLTDGLLRLLFKRGVKDQSGLPEDIEPIFTRICDTRSVHLRHGRVILAAHLNKLFQIDPAWTEKSILPLLDWDNNPHEAVGAWQGFLWRPRIRTPLVTPLKSSLLNTAGHYADLGDQYGNQYAAVLTHLGLERPTGFTDNDLATALATIPAAGLESSAETLVRALEARGDRQAYWLNHIMPFWRQLWPKRRQVISPQLGEELARLVIAAGDAFPDAFASIIDWLCPLRYASTILSWLCEADLPRRFPQDALRMVAAIVDDHSDPSDQLTQCLEDIRASKPDIVSRADYRRLEEFARSRGMR